ncbi:MAG: hypothetical protein DMF60_19180 [Acidobacteria bacterium]|nr:MAG: hypothetical protein DMF60_19180 [Acidobacteriota bacterium]
MTIRLYLDDDSLTKALVKALRERGVDVVTTSEVVAYASEQGRVLCSFNTRDFYRIHSEWVAQAKSHAGIILALQQRYSVGEQMRRILRIIASMSAENMKDRVEFLNAWG